MSTTTICRGIVRGHTVVLPDDVTQFPDGTEVMVTPLTFKPGTAEAILVVMDSGPHVSPEDVDELEKAIEEAQRPPSELRLFDDLPDETDAT